MTMYDAILPLMDADGYKLDHRRQYPDGTRYVFSNFTNRGSRIDDIDHVVHFGLQAFLQKWAIDAWKPFFEAPIETVVEQYNNLLLNYLGPDAALAIGTDHIAALHELGYLPLEFRSLPEGSLVPLRVPSFTIENTIPEFFWLVNYIETALSASIWQPSTSATISHHFREMLNTWALKTTGSTAGVQFQGHDFSFRGMPGIEAAQASGAGHLLSFLGTDSIASLDFIERYYPGNTGQIAGSIAATEHSVMCAGGEKPEEEEATFKRLITALYPGGFVSAVADTWDLWNVVRSILPRLKGIIMGRDGRLVIRPDSGDPVDILTGKMSSTEHGRQNLKKLIKQYKEQGKSLLEYEYPEDLGLIVLLWETFGGTETEQGYKLLDSHIGSIYGDSITYDRGNEICDRLEKLGFASTNVVFGIGSFTFQYQTRDTFQSAIKATWVDIAGNEKAIFKDPKTDNGMKKSARGRLIVEEDTLAGTSTSDYFLKDGLEVAQQERLVAAGVDQLRTVWIDGKFVIKESFTTLRERLDILA